MLIKIPGDILKRLWRLVLSDWLSDWRDPSSKHDTKNTTAVELLDFLQEVWFQNSWFWWFQWGKTRPSLWLQSGFFDVEVSRLSRVADVRVITSSAATCASHKITETRAPGVAQGAREILQLWVKDNTSHQHTLAPYASYASQLFGWFFYQLWYLPALRAPAVKRFITEQSRQAKDWQSYALPDARISSKACKQAIK